MKEDIDVRMSFERAYLSSNVSAEFFVDLRIRHVPGGASSIFTRLFKKRGFTVVRSTDGKEQCFRTATMC